MTELVDKNCKSVEFYTPPVIVDAVHDYFKMRGLDGIVLDPATLNSNPTRAKFFIFLPYNGAAVPWANGTFVNPPYGKEIHSFLDKIKSEAKAGREIVALLPNSRFEQLYWQELWNDKMTGWVMIRKRVPFLRDVCSKCEEPSDKHEIGDLCEGAIRTRLPAKSNPYTSSLFCYNGTFNHCVKAFRKLGTCVMPRMVVHFQEK